MAIEFLQVFVLTVAPIHEAPRRVIICGYNMTGRLNCTSSTHRPAFFAKTSGVNCCNHSIDRRTFLARRSTRNVVLNAGSKLFIERGFSACSVQDITDAAGVPKGSFYNHFKSKEALAAEVLTEYGKGSTDRSILSNRKLPPLTRLKKHFAALYDHFSQCHDGCLVGKFMAEVSEDTPQIRDELLKVLTLWGEQISAVIAEGQQQGSIRHDLRASELSNFLIDSYEGAILRTRVEKNPAALKAFVKIVFSSIAVAVGR
jgi:TetR/AcrR family transcriptional regulator, transcriptional repressor for nem operon